MHDLNFTANNYHEYLDRCLDLINNQRLDGPMNRSYSDTFPRQKNCQPTSSSSSPDKSPSEIPVTSLNKELASSTRFAFTDLLITILRLDFYHKSDEQSIIFCKRALEVTLKWGELPPKTQNTLRLHMEDEQPFNEDIGALITAIKLDPLLEKNGCISLLGSFLLAILVDGDYDSRFRVLIRHASALLGIHWDVFEQFESTLGDRLADEFKESRENQQTREKKTRLRKYKRYAIIGAATGLGGVLIGVTGGLAAPLIVSSVTALTATTVFAGLTATATTAIFASLFGVAGAGLSGYRMKKRVGEVEEFVIERLTEEEGQGLHCVLCVSGWIEDREAQAFRHHWRHLWLSKEQYTLRWESKYLEELGQSIEYFVSFVVSYAIQRSLMETVLAGIVSAIAWPLVLLGSSSIIDNPWNICTRRAVEAGEHLAEALLTRSHGRRPITLIGFSLGARVIYHCLLEMSKRKPDSLGIIEDVILLGAPVTASPSQWRQICSVVGGRVINGYCKTDWLLRFLYRTMSVQFNIAGTSPVENKNERKIVNYNLSYIVKGHMDYAKKLTKVLEAVGVRVTPLSHDSRTDLEHLEEEQAAKESQNAGKNKETKGQSSSSTSTLDGTSTIVEKLEGLSSSRVQNNDADNEDKEDDEEEEYVGLRFRHQDPLGVDETRGQLKRADSVVSAETFFSAKSTLNKEMN